MTLMRIYPAQQKISIVKAIKKENKEEISPSSYNNIISLKRKRALITEGL